MYNRVFLIMNTGSSKHVEDKKNLIKHEFKNYKLLVNVRCILIQYSTVQYSTVQCSTVRYSTVQYSTVQYSTEQ